MIRIELHDAPYLGASFFNFNSRWHSGEGQTLFLTWPSVQSNLSVLCVNADWGILIKHPQWTMISVLFCLVGLEDGCQSSVKLTSTGIPICLRGASF